MALSRGLAGLAQGMVGVEEQRRSSRERAQLQEFARMTQEKEWARQDRQEKQRADQLAWDNQRQASQDTQAAIADGYRPVGDRMDDVNAALGITDMPTVSIGGQQMRKSANSTDWNTKQAAQVARGQEREADGKLQQVLLQARQMFEGSEGDKNRAVAAGRQANDWEVRETGNGFVRVNPRTGEAVPLMLNGQQVKGKASQANASAQNRFNTEMTTLGQLEKLLDNYETQLNKTGSQLFEGPGNKDDSSLLSAFTAAQMGLKNANGLGVPNFRDMQILSDQLAAPIGPRATYRGKDAIKATIAQVRNQLKIKRQVASDTYGIPLPVEQGVTKPGNFWER
jgi:hypothetical protein